MKTYSILLALLIILLTSNIINTQEDTSNHKYIANEKLSNSELQERVKAYNSWLNKESESNSLELRIDSNSELSVFTTKKINKDGNLLEQPKKLLISPNLVYETKYGTKLKEIEEKYGYDDLANLVIFFIGEFYNKESFYKPYFDVIPRDSSFIPNYWEDSKWIEEELKGFTLMRKIVDYKVEVEKKARGFDSGLFKQFPDVFDETIFNSKNVEWVISFVEGNINYVEYQ